MRRRHAAVREVGREGGREEVSYRDCHMHDSFMYKRCSICMCFLFMYVRTLMQYVMLIYNHWSSGMGGDGGYNSLPPINFIDFIDMSGLIFI